MSLKDLVIDQEKILEEFIENSVSSFVRYDVNQKVVVFLPEALKRLSVPKKIVVYLLALRGWSYIPDTGTVRQDAQPKDIASVIMENGSTVRTHLQSLLKEGYLQKKATKYLIPTTAITLIKDFLIKEK